MRVLAFETSCDETGIALVEASAIPDGFSFSVTKKELLSQAALHAPYGGVFPTLAKREHQKNLPVLYSQFQDDAADAVAVTAGPGLEPALWQGIEFAKDVAKKRGVPLFGVNHMEAHLISSLARREYNATGTDERYILQGVASPVLALLISGGHTEFVVMREWFRYEVIGRTQDDAVGECFDKTARLLGLPYPGGPEISRLAARGRTARTPPQSGIVRQWHLPRPMLQNNTCEMSFSGLKTAVLYALRDFSAHTGRNLNNEEKEAFANEFEESVADVFCAKAQRALEKSAARTFVIGGGVAANTYLRTRLQTLIAEKFSDVEFRLPDPAITGDNAVMIAECAAVRLVSGNWKLAAATPPEELRAVGNLTIER